VRSVAARVFWAFVVVYAVLVVGTFLAMPTRVPQHWSGSGVADRWGSRWESLAMLVLLGVLMVAIFGFLAGRLPLTSPWVNLPHKDYWTTPERLPQARAMLRRDLHVLGAIVFVLLCSIPPTMLVASRAADSRLPAWSVVVMLASLVAVVGYAAWMVLGRWRPPAGVGHR